MKKKSKLIIAFLIIIVIAFSLAACSANAEEAEPAMYFKVLAKPSGKQLVLDKNNPMTLEKAAVELKKNPTQDFWTAREADAKALFEKAFNKCATKPEIDKNQPEYFWHFHIDDETHGSPHSFFGKPGESGRYS